MPGWQVTAPGNEGSVLKGKRGHHGNCGVLEGIHKGNTPEGSWDALAEPLRCWPAVAT